jgi:shikimate kinase
MRDLLGRSRVVVATGGGWAAQPGALDGARRGTLTVWLKVGVEEAVARVVRTGVGRPLLEGPDPVLSAGALLAERVPYYAKSDLAYDTESMSPHEIVEQIVETLRSH